MRVLFCVVPHDTYCDKLDIGSKDITRYFPTHPKRPLASSTPTLLLWASQGTPFSCLSWRDVWQRAGTVMLAMVTSQLQMGRKRIIVTPTLPLWVSQVPCFCFEKELGRYRIHQACTAHKPDDPRCTGREFPSKGQLCNLNKLARQLKPLPRLESPRCLIQ